MKKPLAIAASFALAAVLNASSAFADELFCAQIHSINSITLDNDDDNNCQMVLDLTLNETEQPYVLPVDAAGNQLCLAFEIKSVTAFAPFEACGYYQLHNEEVGGLYVVVEEITQIGRASCRERV